MLILKKEMKDHGSLGFGRLQRESKLNATSNERFETFRRLKFWLIKYTKR